MRPAEIGVIIVLVPPGVEFRVRIAVVDAKPVVRRLSVPLGREFGYLRPGRRFETIRVEGRSQLFGFDVVRNVLDGRNVRNSVEDVAFELFVQVRVRIATRMGDRHPSVRGRRVFCARRKEVPLADRKADDPNASLEVLPVTDDLSPLSLLLGAEILVSERRPQLVRRLDGELVPPLSKLGVHLGESVSQFLDGSIAVAKPHRLLHRLPSVVAEVGRVCAALVAAKHPIVCESFEDALRRFVRPLRSEATRFAVRGSESWRATILTRSSPVLRRSVNPVPESSAFSAMRYRSSLELI